MFECVAEEQVKTILNRVWAKFGRASNIHYHESWGYCFILFGSHDEAQAAMNGLNNSERFTAAAVEVLQQASVQLFLEPGAGPTAHYFNLFGICPAPRVGEVIIRASWAAPAQLKKYSRYREYDYDRDSNMCACLHVCTCETAL
ncbi:hypothetical protein B484DRAFT_460329 [Ochromonadaceae sp. CCMP2298]|nr:hypothetical protein B484DRAFT_460329 [Ochromonadaceae sp. CCMP2298]